MMGSRIKIACFCIFAGWLSLGVRAQDFKPVKVDELKESPQRYWAKGVIFEDTLAERPEERVREVGDTRTYRFETRELGDCYADETIVDMVRNLEPGEAYMFAGTVYQYKRRYYFIVQDVSDIATDFDDFDEVIRSSTEGYHPFYGQAIAELNRMLESAQKELFAYTKEKNVAMEDLFDPEKGHLNVVATSLRNSLRTFEDEYSMPTQEFIITLLSTLMAEKYGYLQTNGGSTYDPETSAIEIDMFAIPDASAADAVSPIEEIEDSLIVSPTVEEPVENNAIEILPPPTDEYDLIEDMAETEVDAVEPEPLPSDPAMEPETETVAVEPDVEMTALEPAAEEVPEMPAIEEAAPEPAGDVDDVEAMEEPAEQSAVETAPPEPVEINMANVLPVRRQDIKFPEAKPEPEAEPNEPVDIEVLEEMPEPSESEAVDEAVVEEMEETVADAAEDERAAIEEEPAMEEEPVPALTEASDAAEEQDDGLVEIDDTGIGVDPIVIPPAPEEEPGPDIIFIEPESQTPAAAGEEDGDSDLSKPLPRN